MLNYNIKIIILVIILLGLGAGVGFLAYNFLSIKTQPIVTTLPPPEPQPVVNNNVNNNANQVVNQNLNENINQTVDSSEVALQSYPEETRILNQAVREQNPQLCNQMEVMSKDECLYYVAIGGSLEGCQLISDQIFKAKCLDYYSSHQAIEKNDLQQCKDIQTDEFRQQCLYMLFAQQSDVAYCDNFTDADRILCLDIIIKNNAIRAVDLQICAQIQNIAHRADCEKIITYKLKQ